MYIHTYTNARRATQRRGAGEKEISSHKGKNEAIIQWYWTAGWPENRSHHTSSRLLLLLLPLLLLFFSFYISPLRPFTHTASLCFFPLVLPCPPSPCLLCTLLFKGCQMMTRKMSLLYNKSETHSFNTDDIFPPDFAMPLSHTTPPPPPIPSLCFSSVSLLSSHFYCETGVEGPSSWNFYEYWSAGSAGLWKEERGLEEEWWRNGGLDESGRRCS